MLILWKLKPCFIDILPDLLCKSKPICLIFLFNGIAEKLWNGGRIPLSLSYSRVFFSPGSSSRPFPGLLGAMVDVKERGYIFIDIFRDIAPGSQW